MTREEAVSVLERIAHTESKWPGTEDTLEALDMAISALRAQQEQERNDRLQRAMNRLGEFGKLFVEYKGCPRGAIGRACVPLEEEVFAMPEIEDIDGGRWVPVNAEALRELVNQYKRMMTREESNDPLTLDELRQMDGEPVWVICDKGFELLALWALVEVCEESIFLTNNLGGRTEYAADVELEGDGITVYRRQAGGGDGMKCKFEHDEDCCNCGSPQYMCKCKPMTCGCAVPMTNADRIRAMSDEELTEFLGQINTMNCDCCIYMNPCRLEYDTETVNYAEKYHCKDGILKWLQQPAEEDDHESL